MSGAVRSGVPMLALAHVVADSVEAAYRRGDLFQKRVAIMAAWGAYCERPYATAQ